MQLKAHKILYNVATNLSSLTLKKKLIFAPSEVYIQQSIY